MEPQPYSMKLDCKMGQWLVTWVARASQTWDNPGGVHVSTLRAKKSLVLSPTGLNTLLPSAAGQIVGCI